MNDKRFIELLNLYVDHQITQDEAAELEAEISHNSDRRKTYRDYCRMQRACGMLFESGRQSAPASFALAKSLQETERKINIRADASRRRTGWQPYATALGGFAAMAACVTIAIMHPGQTPAAAIKYGNPDTGSLMTDGATRAPAPSAQLAALIPRAGTSSQLGLSGQNFMPADTTALHSGATGWMNAVSLASAQRVLANDNVFTSQPTLEQNNRVFTSSHPLQGGMEFTAFEFQR